MQPKARLVAVGLVVFVLWALVKSNRSGATGSGDAARDAACAGPSLRAAAQQAALERGYDINPTYNCIDRRSVEQMAANAAARADRALADSITAIATPQPSTGATLADARRGVQTKVSQRGTTPYPLPEPPANLFRRTDYFSGSLMLAAFITPDPRDGRKHPAIIWITGGESNSLDDFWTPGPDAHDESASAFRNAGVVVMFPTLRGGNSNPGGKEYFYGEVDDVLAAAEHLAQQPYVDTKQIYLGGHSTGGTLALLTAESSGRFKSVFAFGPVGNIQRYGSTYFPVSPGEQELKLRSPTYWLHGISSPTYLIEGVNPPGNIGEMDEMCTRNRNPLVRCIRVAGADHFSVLAKVNRVISARLSVAGDVDFTLRPEEFATDGARE